MALLNFKQIMTTQAFEGQSKTSAARTWSSDIVTFYGRLGEGKQIYKTREATDALSDANLTTRQNLELQDMVTYDDVDYEVVDKITVRRGQSDQILHYSYLLKII